MKALALAALLALLPTTLNAGNLQSIYWSTGPHPCTAMAGPVVANPGWYPNCPTNAEWSICPVDGRDASPYNAQQSITIKGWIIVQRLSDPDAQGHTLVGSASAVSGADVFAAGAGHGSWSANGRLPVGLAQGGSRSNQAHLDVYSECDKGTEQLTVVLQYSSP